MAERKTKKKKLDHPLPSNNNNNNSSSSSSSSDLVKEKSKERNSSDKYDEEENKDLVRYYEQLDSIQVELKKLNDEVSDKILEIERRYDAKRKPFYRKRNQAAANIPLFWLKTFKNHPRLRDFLKEEEDQKALEYLKQVEVEELEDVQSGCKITFTFAENPWFENTQLWKFVKITESELVITSSEIKWKPGKDLTKIRIDGNDEVNPGSFFCWFNHSDDLVQEQDQITEIIHEEIWPEPTTYYHGIDLVEDEEEEAEEASEEEDRAEEGEGEGDGEDDSREGDD